MTMLMPLPPLPTPPHHTLPTTHRHPTVAGNGQAGGTGGAGVGVRGTLVKGDGLGPAKLRGEAEGVGLRGGQLDATHLSEFQLRR